MEELDSLFVFWRRTLVVAKKASKGKQCVLSSVPLGLFYRIVLEGFTSSNSIAHSGVCTVTCAVCGAHCGGESVCCALGDSVGAPATACKLTNP